MNDASTSKPERLLIIALTYGEPEEAHFLKQYHYSLLILKRLTRKIAQIPKSLLPLIALFRGYKRVKQWRKEKYRSPLEKISREQVSSLLSILQDRDPSRHYEIRLVFEFRPPLLPEVLSEIENHSPDKIYFLPLYIVDSDFTSGISEEDYQEYLGQSSKSPLPKPDYISAFTEDARMIDLIEQFLDEQLNGAGWSENTLKEAALILSAHGTPIHEPEGINTGYQAMLRFYQQLETRLSTRFAPGFQSVG